MVNDKVPQPPADGSSAAAAAFTAAATAAASAGRGGRSPNFPAITYTEAEGHAFKLWSEDKQFPMTKDVASKHLGYSKSSGATLPLFAAMKRYGLLESVGTDLRVTNEAHFMFLHPNDAPERVEMRRKLAMKPELFGEVLQKYSDGSGNLPSDGTLKARLQYDLKFASAEAAETFIMALRESIAIAGGTSVAAPHPGGDNNGHPITEAPMTNPHEATLRAAISPTVGARSQPPAAPPTATPQHGGQSRRWDLGGGTVMTVALPNPSELRKRHLERLKKYVAALEMEASISWEDEDEWGVK